MGITAIAIFLFFPETQYTRHSPSVLVDESKPSEKQSASETIQESGGSVAAPSKKTFLQELKPWSKINSEYSYLVLLLRPLPLVVYPAIIFSFLTFSTALGWLLSILTTYASVFQAPPYNMSTGISSLINIAAIIGCLIGGYSGGALTDKIAEWQARKNNGTFEPEARLLALVVPFFVVPLGVLMYAMFEIR
jgi:hypothetical protein